MNYKIYPKLAGTEIDSACCIPGDGSITFFSLLDPSAEVEAYTAWVADGGVPEVDNGLSEHPLTPKSVAAWQAKTALIQAGLFAKVENAVNTIPGEAGEQARADWVSAVTWRRDWATIAMMQQAFGWTDEYVDQLFVTASQL